MNPEDRYGRWQEKRSGGTAPPGFADRVMASVHDLERARAQMSAWQLALAALGASRLGRLGLCAVAALVCLFRMASFLALFLPD